MALPGQLITSQLGPSAVTEPKLGLTREQFWPGGTGASLQAMITAITDATAAAPYTIHIPPGTWDPGVLLLKPFVNLKGAGGGGRVTIFAGTGASSVGLLDAAIAGGQYARIRLDGIRFETCPVSLICTTTGKRLSAVIDDCPMNGNTPLVVTGEAYGAAATMVQLELRGLNLDRNAAPQMFTFARVSFWQCQLMGMYFTDSDAYFFACDFTAGCNFVTAGVAGGWFEFQGCKIDRMLPNDPTSESVLFTAFTGGNENVQVHGNFCGATAPGTIGGFIHMQPGAIYFCSADDNLYVKTGLVGVNTWVDLTV